jgi:CheY-like chemotaxis protein
LAGGIAHDFNNLVGTMIGHCTLLKMKLRPSDPFFRPLEVMEQTCRQALELTQELSGLSRPTPSLSAPLDLNRVAARVAASFRRTLDPAAVFETNLQEKCWAVMGDAGRLEHALLELCLFAREVMSPAGRLTLSTQNLILDESSSPGRIALRPGPYVLATISYPGPAFSAEDLRHIFDPFWTPANSTKGSGLRLALVYAMIQAHHGQLQAESQPGQENRFLIYLPAFPEKAIPSTIPAEPAETESLPAGTETILVVDDDPLVRELLAKELTTLGYQALSAATGEEADAMLKQHRGKVDLVILDWIMPGWGGKGTFQRLRQQYPSLKILISSGYGLDHGIQETLQAGASGFLPKPFLITQLAQTLRKILAADQPAGSPAAAE